MAEITFAESIRQIDRLDRRARADFNSGSWAAAIAGWRAVLHHPCAHHQIDAGEVLGEIHHAHRAAGEYDAAITAKREAIAAGYRSVPDPEADIAECLLLAGRRLEAEALFAELRERDPDDVWLNSSAGMAYVEVGDHDAAERWLRTGIELAIATGDPDEAISQLADLHDGAIEALGREPDPELGTRVMTFMTAWTPVAHSRPWDDDEPRPERPCGHCDFDPARSYAELEERARRDRGRLLREESPGAWERLEEVFGPEETLASLAAEVPLMIGWFAAGEWETAIARWPDLLEVLPPEQADYNRAIEARIKWAARAMAGRRLLISPMTVAGLVAYADDERSIRARPRPAPPTRATWLRTTRRCAGRPAATSAAGAAPA